MAFLVVIPIAMLCAIIFDKKIEETLALSMIWATLLTYLCGIVYELWIASYLIAGISVISLGAAVYLGIRRKAYRNIFTFGLLQYLLLCGYYLLIFKGRYINNQDSLRVYEKFTREFYYVGDICRYRNPIGLMLWKYLGLQFWPNYSEGIQLFGGATLWVALLVFVLRDQKDNKLSSSFIRNILGLFFMLFLPLTFKSGITSRQFDYISGILTAFVLVAYLSLKRTKDYFYKVLIISGLVYLVHIKTTGIILALICVMIIAGMELVYGEIEGIRRYRFSIVCAVVSVVSKLSWSLFCRFNDGEEKFSLLHAITTLNILAVLLALVLFAIALVIGIRILLKKNLKAYISVVIMMAIAIFGGTTMLIPSGSRVQTLISFTKMIFSNYCIDREYGLGSIFLAPYIIVIITLPCLLYILSFGGDDVLKQENKIFMILVNTGFILYASVVYLTNFYGRTLNQTVKAKECERYLYVYIIVFISLFLMTVMNYYNKSALYKAVIGMLIVITVFSTDVGIFYKQVVNRPDVETYDVMHNIDIEFPDVIYFVDERKEQSLDRFHFVVSPGRAVETDYSDMYLDFDEIPHKLSHEEWVEKLRECRYVYLATTDENFAEEYGDIFDDEIIDGRIYSVITDGADVRLQVVNIG